jgi:hypothetical protein
MKKNAPLDLALRSSVPDSEIPPALHSSIMRALQGAGPSASPARKPAIVRWLPIASVVALACAAWAWHLGPNSAPPQSAFERAGMALATGQEMARAVPVTALAPLTEEWQRLNQDLDNTAQFLLATLP